MNTRDYAPSTNEPLRINGVSRGCGNTPDQHSPATDIEAIDAGGDTELAAGELQGDIERP